MAIPKKVLETCKITEITDISDHNEFFEQVENYPKINYHIYQDTLLNIILLAEKYKWVHREEYYEKIFNKVHNKDRKWTNKLYSALLTGFIKSNKKIDNIITQHACNYIELKFYDIIKIRDIFYDKCGFPIYYKYNKETSNYFLNKISDLVNFSIDIGLKIISGGLLTGLFINELYDDSDCDIWYITDSNNVNINLRDGYYAACYETFCYVYNTDPKAKIKKIQLMKFGHDNSLSLINGFDLDINRIAITYNGLFISCMAYDQLINKKINCLMFNKNTNLKTLSRLSKYKSRGFELINLDKNIELPEYKKIIYTDFESFRDSIKYIDKDDWKINVLKFTKDKIFDHGYLSLLCETPLTKTNNEKLLKSLNIKSIFSDTYIKTSYIYGDVIILHDQVIIFVSDNSIENDINSDLEMNFNISVKSVSNKYCYVFSNTSGNITINGEKIIKNKKYDTYNCNIIITFAINIYLLQVRLYMLKMNVTSFNIFSLST